MRSAKPSNGFLLFLDKDHNMKRKMKVLDRELKHGRSKGQSEKNTLLF